MSGDLFIVIAGVCPWHPMGGGQGQTACNTQGSPHKKELSGPKCQLCRIRALKTTERGAVLRGEYLLLGTWQESPQCRHDPSEDKEGAAQGLGDGREMVGKGGAGGKEVGGPTGISLQGTGREE